MLGVDALGIGLGAGFGGFGGALDGNFAGDAVTLFADMKEQSMAQARFSCTMVWMRSTLSPPIGLDEVFERLRSTVAVPSIVERNTPASARGCRRTSLELQSA